MVHLIALLIFAALAAACWFVSLALYKASIGGSDPVTSPDYATTACVAIGVVALTSFVPFPLGYVAGLVVWAVAAFGGLSLSTGRAAVLFGYLAVSSFVARLVVLGVMELFGA